MVTLVGRDDAEAFTGRSFLGGQGGNANGRPFVATRNGVGDTLAVSIMDFGPNTVVSNSIFRRRPGETDFVLIETLLISTTVLPVEVDPIPIQEVAIQPLVVRAGEEFNLLQIGNVTGTATGGVFGTSVDPLIQAPASLGGVEVTFGSVPNVLPDVIAEAPGQNFFHISGVPEPTVSAIDGVIAAGEQLTITTTVIGDVEAVTLSHPGLSGVVDLVVDDNSSPNTVLVSLPARLNAFDWGQEGLVLTVSDGVLSAEREGITLLAPPGMRFVNTTVAPDPLRTDSLIELAGNTPTFDGYVFAPGQQFQFNDIAGLEVLPNTSVNVRPGRRVEGVLSVRYLVAGEPRYISSPFVIEQRDLEPDVLTFIDLVDAIASTSVTSSTTFLSGFNEPLPITVSGGEYSINGSTFTELPGVVERGQSLRLRATTAPNYPGEVSVVVTIGDVSSVWRVVNRSEAPDSVPAGFVFNSVSDAVPRSLVVSNEIQVLETNEPSPISIVGGEYSLDGGVNFVAASAVVAPNTRVLVRVTASELSGRVVEARLNIGGVESVFNVTTAIDVLAPVISLVDGSTIDHEVNTPFIDPGFSATDNFDQDLTSSVIVTGSVDTSRLETFLIEYAVVDEAGNSARVTRSVRVVPASPLPVREPIDARFYVEPGCSEEQQNVLYLNNSNLIIVDDIVEVRTRALANVSVAWFRLQDGDDVVYGPAALNISTNGVLLGSIPRDELTMDVNTVQLVINIDTVDGGRARLSKAFDLIDRD